jgi:hypothetical protein
MPAELREVFPGQVEPFMSSSSFWMRAAVGALLSGVITSVIWTNKGGTTIFGFAMGFFLGLIGILIAVLARPGGGASYRYSNNPVPASQIWDLGTHRTCPHCHEMMHRDAVVCAHCKRESNPWHFQYGYWWTKDDSGADYWLDPLQNRWKPVTEFSDAPSPQQRTSV